MEINGKIYKILPQEAITLNDGTTRKKCVFVIMRDDDYPRPVAFELFGEERISLLNSITQGMLVTVSFSPESREGRNGNFYTTLRCFNISRLVSALPPAAPATNIPTPTATHQESWNPSPATIVQNEVQSENDLPFDDDILPF